MLENRNQLENSLRPVLEKAEIVKTQEVIDILRTISEVFPKSGNYYNDTEGANKKKSEQLAESFFKLPEGSLSHVRENLSKVWVDKKTDVYYKIDLSKTAEEANRYKQYIEALKEIGADRFAVLPEVAVIPIAADGVEYGIVSSIQKSAGVEGNLVRQLAGKAFTRKDDMLFGQLYDQNATTKNDHDGILKSEIGTGLTNAGLVIGKDGMARAYAFDFDGMGDDKLSIDEVKRLSQEVLASVLDMSGVPLEEFSPEVQKIIRDNQAGSSLVNK